MKTKCVLSSGHKSICVHLGRISREDICIHCEAGALVCKIKMESLVYVNATRGDAAGAMAIGWLSARR